MHARWSAALLRSSLCPSWLASRTQQSLFGGSWTHAKQGQARVMEVVRFAVSEGASGIVNLVLPLLQALLGSDADSSALHNKPLAMLMQQARPPVWEHAWEHACLCLYKPTRCTAGLQYCCLLFTMNVRVLHRSLNAVTQGC
jgi:hypothetical protein